MQVSLRPGTYVVAVSGGVDSVVLLDLLVASDQPDTRLIITHFDHGIREASATDAQFVRDLAEAYQLECEVGEAKLGSKASEELARETRYSYLRVVQKKYDATAIITAHHQDDVLETAIINLVRGTGRHGLSSLRSQPGLIRPLLTYTKQEIVDYASSMNLKWVEDETNSDPKYLRNYIRSEVLPRFDDSQKEEMLALIQKLHELNDEIDSELAELLTRKSHKRESRKVSRSWFNKLPHQLALEVVHHWLRNAQVSDYDRDLIEYIVVKLKTLRPGKTIKVSAHSEISLSKRSILLDL